MRGFTEVFMLELRMRRSVFPAALVAGLIPIPMALMMKGVATFPEALNMGAYVFALIGGELLALYLGATVLCQDLSEGRQGFYFARPISGFALWAGKFTAAWAVVLGAMFVVLIPATFMGEGLANLSAADNPLWVYDLGPQTLSPLWSLVFPALAVLFFMGLAHAVSLMFRSRSSWLLLDGIMVVLLPALAWWGLKRLTGSWEMFGLLTILFLVYAAGALLAILPAGALQTAFGRCDLKRGHKILSLTIWGTATVFVLGCSAFAYHVTHFTPTDLKAIEYANPAPEGDWAVVSGPTGGLARYLWPTFLVNTKTGAWISTNTSRWNYGPFLSPDGKLALCIESEGGGYRSPSQIVSYDLAAPGTPQPQSHGVFVQGIDTRIVFSPDSTRIALLADKDLSVLDLSTWKVLAVQRLPSHGGLWERSNVAFSSRDNLLIFEGPAGPRDEPGTIIMEFDVPGKKLLQTGHLEAGAGSFQLDESGRRMLATLRKETGRDLILCDAKTGTVLSALVQNVPYVGGRFLSDGRILASERGAKDTTIRLFSSEGQPERTFSLGASRSVWAFGEEGNGQVLIRTWEPKSGVTKTGDIRLLDLTKGAAHILAGLKPCAGFWSFHDDSWWRARTSKLAWFLFLNDQSQLVRYDFATGTTTPVNLGK